MLNVRLRWIILAMAAVLLTDAAASQAASYTWTGTSSNVWELNANWGGSGFPNAYTDAATIPSAGANRPVVVGALDLVGTASGNALTISGAASGSTSVSLDISAAGTLGVQGGVSIGTRRQLTIEGILRNDAPSSATTYTISGAPILNGGTISALNGGIWNFGSGVTGYGTISSSFTLAAGVVNAVGTGGVHILHVTGDATLNVQRGLGGTTTNVAGNLLSIEGGTITGGGTFGNGIDNYANVDLRGTFNSVTLYLDGSGTYNVRGDSTWNGGYLNTMYFNGYKIDATGSIGNYGSVHVDAGTLNNPGAAATTISNGNFVYLAGGTVASSGGGGFSLGSNLRGYGTVSSPITGSPNGGILSQGGTLVLTAPLFLNGSANMGTGAGSVIALAGANISSNGLTRFTDSATVSGYGVVTAPFDNNGKVIGDGNGSDANTFDLSGATALVPGTNTGGMGWFARNHGRLLLPAITVASSGPYNWGGNPTTQGMVNSLGLAFTNVTTPDALSIALLSPDRGDVPAGLTNPIGVWSVQDGSLAFDSVALTVRYDDAAAGAISVDESLLGLFGFDGTNWVPIPINPVDTTNKLISTSGEIESLYQDLAVAATPEPATMSLMALGGLGMLYLKRRRKA
jgi:hypothetical protein